VRAGVRAAALHALTRGNRPTRRRRAGDRAARRHLPSPRCPGGLPSLTLIEARSVSKRYGERLALKDVSMSAGRGDIVGIIGPNGAGKTTLLSILAGIQTPSSGEIQT